MSHTYEKSNLSFLFGANKIKHLDISGCYKILDILDIIHLDLNYLDMECLDMITYDMLLVLNFEKLTYLNISHCNSIKPDEIESTIINFPFITYIYSYVHIEFNVNWGPRGDIGPRGCRGYSNTNDYYYYKMLNYEEEKHYWALRVLNNNYNMGQVLINFENKENTRYRNLCNLRKKLSF